VPGRGKGGGGRRREEGEEREKGKGQEAEEKKSTYLYFSSEFGGDSNSKASPKSSQVPFVSFLPWTRTEKKTPSGTRWGVRVTEISPVCTKIGRDCL
jgi:hypothetical protein